MSGADCEKMAMKLPLSFGSIALILATAFLNPTIQSAETPAAPQAQPVQHKPTAESAPPQSPADIVPARADKQHRTGDWRNASPEERMARSSTNKTGFNKMTPKERQAKRQEIKERFEKKIKQLRQKKSDGTITSEEEKQLKRMELIMSRFKQNNAPKTLPQKRADPSPNDKGEPAGDKQPAPSQSP